MKTPKSIESIKSWAEQDRPREKMLLKGRANLTDAELIAIILGSGSRDESAVSLAKRILSSVDHNLYELGKLSITDLMKFKGIGEAKAISIVAALEIGRRRGLTEVPELPVITCSKDAEAILRPHLTDIGHEEMWVLLLNQGSKVIKKLRISSGGTTATVVDIKIIIKAAIDHQAQAIVLAHNHPSGSLKPSRQDINITQKIKESAKFFDMTVADHLIITDKTYYSFLDEGMI